MMSTGRAGAAVAFVVLLSVNRTGAAGGSSLFDLEDTNFQLHVDQAHVEYAHSEDYTWRIGRQQYSLGRQLLVDNNYDGVQVELGVLGSHDLTLGWAKVSEGGDSTSDLHGADAGGADAGGADNRDADLLLLDFASQAGGLSYNAFGVYYVDRSDTDGNAYIPNHQHGQRHRQRSTSVSPTASATA
jgi:hypothetical protein